MARVYEPPYEDLCYPSDATTELKIVGPQFGPALSGQRIVYLKRLAGSVKEILPNQDLKFCRLKDKDGAYFVPCEHMLAVLGQPWIESSDPSAVPGYVSALLAWDYDEKVREIGNKFVEEGSDVMGWLCLGGLYRKRKEWLELMSICKRGIRKYPDVPDFYGLLAQAYLAEGTRFKAIETLEQGIEKCDGAEGLKAFLDSLESGKGAS
ncbi:MAG: hypothetical protein HYY93_01420 [Planctomycetes bacterium]|nr:hypothetical protein [Planctomycetota bacterium]